MTRTAAIVLAVVAVLGVVGVVLATQVSGPDAAQSQTLNVRIRGNMGAAVTADDGPVVNLKAYDGTDSTTVTASRTVRVVVTSTGEAPSCSVTTPAGAELASETGAAPHRTDQTVGLGYGPASIANVPTQETATCTVDLPKK